MTDDLNGWRANVIGEDFVSDRLRIALGVRGHNFRSYVKAITDGPMEMETVSAEGFATGATLAVPIDAARALLDALSAHFGGTGVGREQRADLLHERGRVDKLIDRVEERLERLRSDRADWARKADGSDPEARMARDIVTTLDDLIREAERRKS